MVKWTSTVTTKSAEQKKDNLSSDIYDLLHHFKYNFTNLNIITGQFCFKYEKMKDNMKGFFSWAPSVLEN